MRRKCKEYVEPFRVPQRRYRLRLIMPECMVARANLAGSKSFQRSRVQHEKTCSGPANPLNTRLPSRFQPFCRTPTPALACSKSILRSRYCTPPFAKFSRKERYSGNVLAATKVLVQAFPSSPVLARDLLHEK